jgi:SpoVK/Ycf46/Vps4 family AAA+-type ATPase
MLCARESKIFDGPQILDKYVGESEANIRKAFVKPKDEEKKVSQQFIQWRSQEFLSHGPFPS